jgi:hypothetical protein
MQKINITDTETDTEILTQTEQEIITETKFEKKENIKILFKIPILWIPCLELLDILERKRISKKIFKNHYSNCSSCQYNNNNHNFQFTFNLNHKINLINHFSVINYYNYYNDPNNNFDDSTSDSYDCNVINNTETETETESENSNNLEEYESDSENDILYDDQESKDEESKDIDILIEKIVRCYSTSINYEEEIENIKLIGLENDMYNILYYNNINEDHIYNNSLFIIK